jgi:predicted metallopeptidase
MDVQKDEQIQGMVDDIIQTLESSHLNAHRIICMRSHNTTARAYARIWNLPDIWQKALDVGTFYVIEVLSGHFDKLSKDEQEKVLIHELLHIPKTFSGALLAHGHPTAPVNERTASKLWKEYRKKKEAEKEQYSPSD